MIFYFSGTGNSRYAAERIGKIIGDQAVDLFEKIRGHDFSPLHSDRPWVVVAPTYAWRIPHVVARWLKNTPLSGSRDIYFVLTCGGSIGNAGQYLENLSKEKGLHSLGCAAIIMPENYIALFSTPTAEQARSLMPQADCAIENVAGFIRQGQAFLRPAVTLADRVNSGAVNILFYPLLVHAKKFYATDACTSCGTCARLCPMSNIRIAHGAPVWGKHCTHCMACICRCPASAIEYGSHSKDLPRYVCPDSTEVL